MRPSRVRPIQRLIRVLGRRLTRFGQNSTRRHEVPGQGPRLLYLSVQALLHGLQVRGAQLQPRFQELKFRLPTADFDRCSVQGAARTLDHLARALQLATGLVNLR